MYLTMTREGAIRVIPAHAVAAFVTQGGEGSFEVVVVNSTEKKQYLLAVVDESDSDSPPTVRIATFKTALEAAQAVMPLNVSAGPQISGPQITSITRALDKLASRVDDHSTALAAVASNVETVAQTVAEVGAKADNLAAELAEFDEDDETDEPTEPGATDAPAG